MLEWHYTVTKTNTPHIVPLFNQTVENLRELQPLTGQGHLVFPGARGKGRPMSDNTILAAMRRMGIGKNEMRGHGAAHSVPQAFGPVVLWRRRCGAETERTASTEASEGIAETAKAALLP